MTVEPPMNHELNEEVPECDTHRPYSDLRGALVEAWDCSYLESERRMDKDTLGQCEWIIQQRWINGKTVG